jgi:hypothetical protein
MPRRSREGVEVQIYSFFNLGAGYGRVVKATPRPLYPRERPGTNCIGGCVGPKVGLDGCEKSRPHRYSNPGPSSPQRLAIPTTPCFLLTNYNPKIHRNQYEY